jgi:hypothetical protein
MTRESPRSAAIRLRPGEVTMRRHATALRLRRVFRATVHAAARRAARVTSADTPPAVAHIVADLDEIECASAVASALAWRRRTKIPA